MDAYDERMLAAFSGVYLIHLDVDEWGWVTKYGFNVQAIPIFYKLDTAGKPNGEVIDGNAWGENIPENMAPPLEKFFHAK